MARIAVTEQISRVDLRKPVLAGALVSGGLAIAIALYKVATPTADMLGASAAAAGAPVAAPAKLAAAAPTITPVAAPAAQAAPTVLPIVDKHPELVELTLTSKPAGATIMVVDRGVTSLAGTTPLALSVDPSRAYDLVFTVAGQPPKTEHVDPKERQQVAVDLAPAAPPAVAVKAKPSKRAGKHHRKLKPTS